MSTMDITIHAVDDAGGRLFIHYMRRRRELANPFASYHQEGEQRVMKDRRKPNSKTLPWLR